MSESDHSRIIGTIKDLRDNLQLVSDELRKNQLPTWHISDAINALTLAIEDLEERSNELD